MRDRTEEPLISPAHLARSPHRRREPTSDIPRYDAIHRALLSGLLGNVGQKTDPHEYTGARGMHFNIFPGSSLFQREPQWVMAAELVETTRLYARTVAKIHPEWIEGLADHLVKRTYSDPHWNPDTAHVVAYEKVTLYGLTIIPQRTVHYGPIDPKRSREIFIQALVDGEFRLDAPFLRHNQRLIDEIERLEAKSRQRDVLVPPEARYDFYDARIPAGIYNGPLFDRWRRQIERQNPKILHMTRHDLMMHGAAGITQEQFPDFLLLGELRLPLEYHLEPGHPADGVTATIPLPILNQVPAERFEWLVPGLLREKITALIKSLPKNLRVSFVPAPDFAQSAMETLKPGDGSLLDALAMFLGKQAGFQVPIEAFDPSTLLDHLHMNFRIVDESGKQLAMGRDLNELRHKLGVQVKATFEKLPHPKYQRDNITTWDFDDLPESVPVQRHGMTLTAYPALVDNGNSVSLRLLDSKETAQAAHAAGLRRLLVLQLRDELQYLASNIPNLREMSLYYSTLGSAKDLKEDLIGETINRAFLVDVNVRTPMEFELRLQAGRRHRLIEVGREVADLASRILTTYHAVALLLSKPTIPAFAPSIADIKDQLAHLMPKGFLTTTPDAWLMHYPRYLKAIQSRIQKLSTAGHTRDAQHLAEVTPFWQAYLARAKQNQQEKIHDPQLELFRWMIEELRVSLFAQELKTAIPVSPKRLEKQWELVRKPLGIRWAS
ncbi:MAG TPA: ATP-dependent RNA helicase HrpA [Tepidisphaeraceae bacterium]|nr:ATP-dependent RNA helicase HrpA [Tepidisphaeraceae bacterium]